MPSITGIELGPDSCVLVRARQRAKAVEVSAFHQIERAAWPPNDTALATTLRQLRKSMGFPRRARVVVWGLTEPGNVAEAFVRSLITPVTAAGFRVERVLTPPEALAEIARTRPRGRGVAAVWLALNVHGAAIAIVRDGTLLFGRTFDWTYTPGAVGPRAEMLQRYSLVSHLAPEVRRGMTLVRSAHGAIVEAAITCGDLPDLRSLTMPLIEELDLEVETLDATDGLLATKRPLAERFAESAPAIRLATAATTMRFSKGFRASPLVRAAAAAVIIAALGWFGYQYWIRGRIDVFGQRTIEAPRSVPAPTAGTSPARSPQARATFPAPTTPVPGQTSPMVAGPAPPVTAPPVSTPATQPPPPPASKPAVQVVTAVPPVSKPAAQATPPPPVSKPAAQVVTAAPPVSKPPAQATPPPPASKPAPQAAVSPPASKPAPQVVTAPPVSKPVPPAAGPPPVSKPAPQVAPPPATPPVSKPAPQVVTAPPVSKPAPPATPPPARADTESAATKPADAPRTLPAVERPVVETASTRTDTSRRKPVPLKAPVPSVQSILVAPDRRIAVIDGQIVTVGDQVGPRTVAGIEQGAVVLQEPSGYQIRIPIRRGRGVE